MLYNSQYLEAFVFLNLQFLNLDYCLYFLFQVLRNCFNFIGTAHYCRLFD